MTVFGIPSVCWLDVLLSSTVVLYRRSSSPTHIQRRLIEHLTLPNLRQSGTEFSTSSGGLHRSSSYPLRGLAVFSGGCGYPTSYKRHSTRSSEARVLVPTIFQACYWIKTFIVQHFSGYVIESKPWRSQNNGIEKGVCSRVDFLLWFSLEFLVLTLTRFYPQRFRVKSYLLYNFYKCIS